MKILLSNDDGFDATGLKVLKEALVSIGQIAVAAPSTNCSGFSNALTLRKPIRAHCHGENHYSIEGTPADCVHLAVNGMIDFVPDLVVSGINHGSNLGDDTIYSGTVAAALEGRFLRLPSIAVSLVGERLEYFDTAARVIVELFDWMRNVAISDLCLLNINVPDIPYDNLQGIEFTCCGKRDHSEPIRLETDQNELKIYQIGKIGAPRDNGPGTDFYAISRQRVSITPLTHDMTHHGILDSLKSVNSQSGLLARLP